MAYPCVKVEILGVKANLWCYFLTQLCSKVIVSVLYTPGWRFGSSPGYGGYHNYHHHENHHHHPHNNDNPYHNNNNNFNAQERVGVAATTTTENTNQEPAAVESILDEGISVGRFRRQNTSSDFANGEGRLKSNLNSCRVENNRVLGRWRCDNGEIIDCNGLCNGRRDCFDQSDETVISCRHVL